MKLNCETSTSALQAIQYWGSFTGEKRPGREDDRPSPSSTDIMYEWSYTSTPPICLHSVDRDKFTFTWTETLEKYIFSLMQLLFL